jgi:hypothetical protein
MKIRPINISVFRKLLCSSLGLVVACAGPSTITRSDVESSYPRAQYITGIGQATGDLARAESRARNDVALQIQSQISSEVELWARSDASGDTEGVSEQIRQTSEFSRLELIHIVPELSSCHADNCNAVAALNRREAAAALRADYQRLRTDFQRSVEQARSNEQNPVEFTLHLRTAEAQYTELVSHSLQMRSIAGHSFAEFSADEAMFNGLRSAQARILDLIRVVVLPPVSLEPVMGEAVLERTTTALRQSGLSAESGSSCEASYGIRPQVDMSCSRGYIGYSCEVTLELVLTDCQTNQNWPIRADTLNWTGAHPSDEGRAAEDAAEQITAQNLADALRMGGLYTLFPIR